MGACIVKDRIKNKVKPALIATQAFHITKISESARKQSVYIILKAKDAKTPILHLKDSLLYQQRMSLAPINM